MLDTSLTEDYCYNGRVEATEEGRKEGRKEGRVKLWKSPQTDHVELDAEIKSVCQTRDYPLLTSREA
jgi:hypothetical protein